MPIENLSEVVVGDIPIGIVGKWADDVLGLPAQRAAPKGLESVEDQPPLG